MILLKNLKILTMAGENLERGDILIDGGKIAKIDTEITQPNAQIFDLDGKTAIPGFIDAHCHVGMWEDGMDFEGADGNEECEPVTPELRAIDGINPADHAFEEARAAGVTTVVTGPGSANVVGGQFVAIKTVGDRVEDMIVKFPQALKVAFGENPKRVYSEQKKSPMTRMANASMLRQCLIDAQEYAKELEKGKKDPDKMPERSLKHEAVLEALKGHILVKAHAHRADDILTAIRIAKEFNLRLSIEHCTEGHLIPKYVKESGAKVILGPLLTERAKIELKNLTFQAPKIMYENGIEFALMTDHPVIPVQFLPVCAAIAVREGLPEMEALKAITIHAARATDIDERVGSLEVGKDADIVITDGAPLDLRSAIEMVLINGEIVHRHA